MMATFDGGGHTVAAAYRELDVNDERGFRILNVQNPNASGGNGMWISFDGIVDMGYIPPDRSWHFSGATIHPNQIWVRGTANDIAFWNGSLV